MVGTRYWRGGTWLNSNHLNCFKILCWPNKTHPWKIFSCWPLVCHLENNIAENRNPGCKWLQGPSYFPYHILFDIHLFLPSFIGFTNQQYHLVSLDHVLWSKGAGEEQDIVPVLNRKNIIFIHCNGPGEALALLESALELKGHSNWICCEWSWEAAQRKWDFTESIWINRILLYCTLCIRWGQ